MRRAGHRRAAVGAARLARLVADPAGGLDRLDRFNRLWPVSACFGAFGFVAVSAGLAGHGSAAAVYALLAASFLVLLVWLLHLDGAGRGVDRRPSRTGAPDVSE